MHASSLVSTLARALHGLRALFRRPVQPQPAPRPAALPSRPVVLAPSTPLPAPKPPVRMAAPVEPVVPAAVQAPQPVQPPTLSWPASTVRPMRSLEEVRADLARLRESSKLRQAQLDVQAKSQARAQMQAQMQAQPAMRHDTSFAPTDFMDIPHPAFAAHAANESHEAREAAHTDFAPTDIMDFAPAQTRPVAKPVDRPAPAFVADDFLDFSALKAPPKP